MAVAARFFVAEIKRFAYDPNQVHLVMRPVARGPENKTWAAATPSGEFTMQINNPGAADWFADRLGREVAITIEDRPLVCPVCHDEIADLTTGYHASESVTAGADQYGLKKDDVVHTVCFEKAKVKSQKAASA